MTKHRACDTIYKPEHTIDLDNGTIVAAETRRGDQGDIQDLAKNIMARGPLP